MSLLEISDICKSFNRKPALHHVSINLEQNNILCLLGPSGCGKTTLLRIIAGLEQPDCGKVVFDGKNMTTIQPHKRNFGMMFQEFALFPHKNVFENIAFGLEIKGKKNSKLADRVNEMLALVGLEGFEKRNVSQLSGGERQRVALARSLAPKPSLLMLDEPLGSLDRALRERLIIDLRRILKKIGITVIFVTHDQTEAFSIADKIAIFDKGKIIQIDTPELLYKYPANKTTANFLGFRNLLQGSVNSDKSIQTDIGILYPEKISEHNKAVTVLLRSECASITDKSAKNDNKNIIIKGRIIESIFQGMVYKITIKTNTGVTLVFNLPNETILPCEGQTIYLAYSHSSAVLLPVIKP